MADTMRRAWLKCLKRDVPEGIVTPAELARFEVDGYLGSGRCRTLLCPEMGEGFSIRRDGSGYILRGGETGLLCGAYKLIMALECGEDPECVLSRPFYPLRMLDCWDNMDGTIERGYAGRSLWFEGGKFSYDPARIRFLGRLLASVGINTLALNNVNVHFPAQELICGKLEDVKRFADLLRPFGIKLMLSVDFAMPLMDGLDTADPLDPHVIGWWRERTRAVYAAVPDLAGFLVKADSEHRPGPNEYGRTHAEGANMLARAIAPYCGKLVWRAFVYNCAQDWRDTKTDRACAAYDFYMPLDGQFDDNVILQIKHGPFDFQVREPVSPLLMGLKRTRMALEVQLAQEYTGQQIDLYAMPPLWKEVFDVMEPERVEAVAAVSNLGRDENWAGHPLAMLNLYAYGRMAWQPRFDAERLIRDWIRLTYRMNAADEDALCNALLSSRATYEKYTATLGLNWMVTPNSHYGPNPWGYEFQAWGTYNRADRNAVGVDRTKAGTSYTAQYPDALCKLYEDAKTCPDELMLFFHRLPYTYAMRDGRTLLQRIYDDHFEGAQEAENMLRTFSELPFKEPDRREIVERMEMQVKNAREWRDVTNTFFHRLSGMDDEKGRKIWE